MSAYSKGLTLEFVINKRVQKMRLALNDKTYFEPEQVDIDNWKELYQNCDVEQELRAMAGWLDANPTRRKTKKGIKRFIANWLARAQDKGGSPLARASGGKKTLRDMSTDEMLLDISFVPHEMMEVTKQYFLRRHGAYIIDGQRFTE